MSTSRKSPNGPVSGPPAEQMSLFGAATPTVVAARAPGRLRVNPHLLAAKKLARRMRRFPTHSPEEIQAGLAICRRLRAYLADDPTPLH